MKMKRLRKAVMVTAAALFFSFQVFAQQTFRGTLIAPSGTPLAGATVTVKGTTQTVLTNEKGEFTVSVPAGSSITVSFVGYRTQEIQITDQTVPTITLQPATQDLGEVVVVGYGTQRKRDLTGSITTVTAEDFQKGQITTPEQLIAGKVAGVQITANSGAPGAGSRIRIRGGSSLSASNDPLIVIDGVPLDNGRNPDGTTRVSGVADPLSMINPNDIASFTVLKDASATAIYGSRASNGVIIITTKQGRSGKPVVNYNTQLSVSHNYRQVDVLSANEFRNLINEKGSAAQREQLGTANTNWQDEIYQTAFTHDHNLSVSGAYKIIPYRVSVGLLDQEGVLRTGNLKRYTGALNLNPRLLDNHLRIDLNLKGTINKTQFAFENAIGNAVIFDPTQPITSDSKRYGGYFEWLDASGLPDANAPRNPLGLLLMRENKATTKRSIGNLQLDYRMHFLPDLRANLNLGYDVSEGEGTEVVPDSAAILYKQKGLSREYRQKRNDKLLEFYLNYARDVDAIDSRIDLLAGYSYQDFLTTNYNFPEYTAGGQLLPNTNPTFPFDKPQNTLVSFYGRLNYSYKSRYLLTASIRRDGSSRFSPENRWGVFPAFALAWNIKSEPMLSNSTLFSQLKLRLGYGVTGQQEGIGNYDYISYYALSNERAQYQLGDTYYRMFRPGGYYANRKWEETKTYNAGLDYGFANNRISGTLDFYYKKTEDLLNQIGQPAGTNFSNQIIANVGNMENKGLEFSINAQPISREELSWDVNFNFTYNRNRITRLTLVPDPEYPGNQFGGVSGGQGNTVQINSVGFPRAAFYVYQQVYDSAGKPLENVFVDRNTDGIINEEDLYHYKSADPRFLLGLSSNLNYGRWSASFVLRANFGNYMYNNVFSNLGRLNVVTGSGAFLNNASVNLLQTGFAGGDLRQLISDYYIQNASFLRMDNFNIGYNIGKVKSIRSIRLNAGVQNVFTITKYDGLDPEISSGIDNSFYPRPTTFVLGLGVDF